MATAEPPVLPFDPSQYQRYQSWSVIIGGAGLALCVAGWWWNPATFVRSYLWAYLFWLGVALGGLALGLLPWLTGGIWGLVLRRWFEAAARTLPILAVLFLPLAFGMRHQYVWTDREYVAADHALQFKTAWYLNEPFWAVRAVVYFVIWIGLAYAMTALSIRQDRPDAPEPRALRGLSAAGLILYALTITLASVDWVMSLEPKWFSSIFGALFGMGQVVTAWSFAVLGVLLLHDRPPLPALLGRPLLRDFGSLLLAFLMVWAYVAFSQFLLIWSGNLPEEVAYYQRRSQGGWEYVAGAIALFHFAVPFVLLLSGQIKRDRASLLRVVILLLVMRMVDLYWQIVPAPRPTATSQDGVYFQFSWTDVVAPVGIGGVWLWFFLWNLQQRRLVPAYDPHLQEAYHHE
ncbi:MAG TPA: hypothetical protein VL371_21075 [Gemmataceae bacterium]|nr:hypothetical protein [Gemmataceae bacterium]